MAKFEKNIGDKVIENVVTVEKAATGREVSRTMTAEDVIPNEREIYQFKNGKVSLREVDKVQVEMDVASGKITVGYIFKGDKKVYPFSEVAFDEKEAAGIALEKMQKRKSKLWGIFSNPFKKYKIIKNDK